MSMNRILFGVIAFIFSALSVLYAQEKTVEELSVLPHGVFKPTMYQKVYRDRVYSQNGQFRCQFSERLGKNSRREITNLKFYNNDRLVFTLPTVPGPDISISNSGYIIISVLQYKEGGDLTSWFYSPKGKFLYRKVFKKASLFGFSPAGKKYGIGFPDRFEVITLENGNVETYPPTNQFAISNDENCVAIAKKNGIAVYRNEKLIGSIKEDIFYNYIYKITFSPDDKNVAFIGRRKLVVCDVEKCTKHFVDKVSGYKSFMDVQMNNTTIWVGIHEKNTRTKMSHGLIRTYNLQKRCVTSEKECSKEKYLLDTSKIRYNYNTDGSRYEIPWPFDPPDEPQYHWNSYCQPVSSYTGVSGAYMHQGLDMDVYENQECFAVEAGICKCYQTMNNSAKHWRTAVCTVNVSEASNGWLYAHLNQSSITVRPGQDVEKYQKLGTIVPWSSSLVKGSHLHFSHIRDVGMEWSVNDGNEWDNVCNPETYLRPIADDSPPTILKAFSYSKLGFGTNDNSTVTWLKPDELEGEIDIYVHISDVIGQSPWTQPAYSIYYWIRFVETNKIVKDRTLGFVRNQYMRKYNSKPYTDYVLLLPVMYRLDQSFPAIGWFDRDRHHLHNITNSGGDSTIQLNDKDNALNTALYGDGDYWICVEAADMKGNKTLDSVKVTFNNGITGSHSGGNKVVTDFTLHVPQFKKSLSTADISFEVPITSFISIKVFNAAGEELKTLVSKKFSPGSYVSRWEGLHSTPPGLYIIKMNAQNFTIGKKCMFVK